MKIKKLDLGGGGVSLGGGLEVSKDSHYFQCVSPCLLLEIKM